MQTVDLLHQQFGRLTVQERGPNVRGQAQWWCSCSCGERKLITSNHLRTGLVKSCGCLRREQAATNGRESTTTHGHRAGGTTPEYRTWRSIKERCLNRRSKHYKNYGRRGIRVCARWLGKKGFENFLADMGTRPTPPDHTSKKRFFSIERRDNNGNYTPENCYWATPKQQQNNRRSNHLVTYAGRIQTITQWAEEVGMSKVTLRWRLAQGWPVEKALLPPLRPW